MIDKGDHNCNNISYTIRVTKMGCIITRKSKQIKTTPITAEKYLRDQLTQHTEDPLDKTLKQNKSLSPHYVQSNKDRRREETDMNNWNGTQTSIAQGHTINNTTNNHKHARIIEKASTNRHIHKQMKTLTLGYVMAE